MIVNQANLRGLDISYSTAFNKSLEETKTFFQEIATVVPSSSAENSYKWLGQLPMLRKWIGERTIQNIAAHGYSIKNEKFEDTISVPRTEVEDDQYGVYTPSFAMLGEAAAKHPDLLCIEALKSGFVNACYDGKPFFSEEHPTFDEGKTSNMSHFKLDATEYEKARMAIMSFLGEEGRSLGIIPDLLVVSPHNEKTARLILEADQINGTTNVLKGTAKLLVVPELADKKDYWFLLATNKFLKPIIYQDREKVKLVSKIKDDDDNVFMRDEYIWGVSVRSNAGYGFWQMAFGSDGTEQGAG